MKTTLSTSVIYNRCYLFLKIIGFATLIFFGVFKSLKAHAFWGLPLEIHPPSAEEMKLEWDAKQEEEAKERERKGEEEPIKDVQ